MPTSFAFQRRQIANILARIQRRYRTHTETIRLGSRDFYFTRVADPNRVLDQVALEADRRERHTGQRQTDVLHLPYWAELWDSAIAMGTFLWERAHTWARASRTLDLGCGMGMSGMVAAAIGHRVLLADLESPALLFARLNCLPFDPMIRARRLDWQTAHLGESFDLILGADILYERQQWEYLDQFFRRHLGDSGQVILGEPGRPTGDDFPAWITQRGWRLAVHEQPLPNRSRPIRLFSLRLEA